MYIKSITVTYDDASGSSSDPTISSDNVEITYDATSGSIAYTLTNEVTGGVVSASVTSGDWLTLGTVGTTVPFTCNANDGVERTATVKLTYTYGSENVTKDVTVTQAGNPNGPGSENNPYTVAQARAAIDAGTGITGVYATGIVTAIPTAWNTQYSNITFNIVDQNGDTDFLQAYRCVSGTGVDASTVAVGDIVVVKGTLKKYNSTYEFAQDCELVSLTHPTVPIITTDPASLTGFTYEVNNGPSAAQQLTIGGLNQTDGSHATLDDNSSFEFSFSENDGYSSDSGLGTQPNDNVVIYVRLKAGLAVGDYTGAITITSAGAETVTVNLSGSVTAAPAPNVTWDLSTASYDAITNDAIVTWSSVYATMTNSSESGGTSASNYLGGDSNNRTSSRFYSGNTLTITPAAGYNITSIEFEATSPSYANALKGSTWTNATAAVENTKVTVTPTDGTAAVSAAIGGTCGFTSVKVYYEAAAPIAPVWSAFPDPQITVGEKYELNLADYVSGFPAPTITIVSGDNAQIESNIFSFTPTAAGPFEFTFKAENAEGSVESTLYITVNPAQASIAVSETTIDIAADETTSYVIVPVTYTNFTTIVAHAQLFEADGTPLTSNPYSWITVATSENNFAYKINEANTNTEPRTVYCKVFANDDAGNPVYSELITITQAGYVDPNAPGTENNPYTVAQARAAIDAGSGTQGVYATGIVTAIPTEWSTQHSNITFNIVDQSGDTDFLQAYRCVSTSNADASTVAVGDIVVVYGNLTKYNTTYEFGQGCQLISLTHPVTPAVPTITLEGATNNTIEYNAAYESYPWGASYAYTVENYSGNSAVQFTYCDASGNPVTDTPSWFDAQISDTHLMFYCRAENTSSEARYGYVKMFIEDAGTKYYSDLITVKQKGNVIDYATLPFEWAGGASADLIALAGVTANGLGTDYASGNAPYLVKLDGTDDYIQVKTNERPGKVTIGVKMIGGSNTSTITVQGSADGTTFTDVQELTISGKQNAELTLTTTNEFAETDRYVRLLFTKGSNVGVGPISIAQYTAPSTDPVINASDVNIAADATEGEIAYRITNSVSGTTLTATSTDAWISNINVEADKVTFDCEANTGVERTATITLSYTGAADKVITVTQGAYVAPFTQTTYTLASAITSGKHYIIVGEKDGTYKAMGEQKSNNRAAVGVTVDNGTATVSSADVKEVVIYGPTTDGLYTIYDASTPGYLYAAGSSSNNLKTEAAANVNGCWEITFDTSTGEASIKATKSSNRNVMQYNSDNSLFSCYATDSQAPVYLYEKVSDTPVAASYTRTATAGNYGTICLPYNATVLGAELYSIAGVDSKTNPTALTLDVAYFAKAGVPYIFKATDAAITAYYTGDKETTAGDANGLIGSFTSENITDATGEPVKAGENPYVIKNNKFCKAGMNVKVGANKAYINLNDVTVSTSGAVKMFIDSDADAIDGINGEIRSGVIYNIAGQRLQRPVRGINIINGKKVLVK